MIHPDPRVIIDKISGVITDRIFTDDAKVPEGCECPKCNEDRMDYLVWVDADLVHCESCGIDYDPSEGI